MFSQCCASNGRTSSVRPAGSTATRQSSGISRYRSSPVRTRVFDRGWNTTVSGPRVYEVPSGVIQLPLIQSSAPSEPSLASAVEAPRLPEAPVRWRQTAGCVAILLLLASRPAPAGDGVVALRTGDPPCTDDSGNVYVDCGNGTVTDNRTGLIWLKDANCASFFAPIDFEDALAEATGLSQGFCGLIDGSMEGDWRLPNVKELLSLVNYGDSDPALPSGHPFTSVQSSAYWSSSTNVVTAAFAWSVTMFSGAANPVIKSDTRHVWPVRGGQ